jgi:hypothetical protein
MFANFDMCVSISRMVLFREPMSVLSEVRALDIPGNNNPKLKDFKGFKP